MKSYRPCLGLGLQKGAAAGLLTRHAIPALRGRSAKLAVPRFPR